jgi:hypothetical protein
MDHAAFENRLSGISFAQPEPGLTDGRGAKTAAGRVLYRLTVRVDQQGGSSVHTHLRNDVLKYDVKCDTYIETGTDGHVYGAQGIQMLKLTFDFFLCLFALGDIVIINDDAAHAWLG